MHKYWECVWRNYSADMTADGAVFMKFAAQEWAKLSDPQEGGDYESFRRILRDPRLRRKLHSIKFRADRLAGVQAAILDGLHKAGWKHTDILLEEDAHLMGSTDSVTFLGQCDRIEILTNPDGAAAAFIADYKTGTGERNEQSTKIESYWWNTDHREKFTKGLQLSVYAALFEREGCDLAGVYILGLESGKISGTIKDYAADIFTPYALKTLGKDITMRINEGAYAMECAARILEKGEFSPEYNSDKCRWCSVKSLCRKGEFRASAVTDEDDN